jgi:hypothetical protein
MKRTLRENAGALGLDQSIRGGLRSVHSRTDRRLRSSAT